MVPGAEYCPEHGVLMMAGKCGRCEAGLRNPSKSSETESPAFRACNLLKSNSKAKFIIDVISGKLRPGQQFEQLYENITNRKAGFATAHFLAGLPEHNGHAVFLHPKTLNNIINQAAKYSSSGAFYSRIALSDSLCILCQEGKAELGSLSLSSVNYGLAADLSDAYSAFVGYLLASPEVVFSRPAKPFKPRNGHKKAREFTY